MRQKGKPTAQPREILDAAKVSRALEDMSSYVLKRFDLSTGDVALVGIQTRGVVLAQRIQNAIKQKKNVELPLGALDITLYRDDVNTSGLQPIVRETHLNFEIDDKHVVLIDDVFFTGRTVRAALDELMDFGRPKTITLAVLIDRGHREIPVVPDFAAIKIPTERTESVNLYLTETDQREEIVVYESQ